MLAGELTRGRRVMPDGITIYPVERLGNQLFQYAAGLEQARRLQVPLYVNRAFYLEEAAAKRRVYSLDYQLDAFDSGIVDPVGEEYHRPIFYGLPPIRTVESFHRRIGSRLPGPGSRIFGERSFGYDPRIHDVVPGTTLLGFFQSWRYCTTVVEEVRRRMAALTAPSAWYAAMCEQLRPGDGSVVLNVRRSDYLLPRQRAVHGVATRSYYERSLRLVRGLGVTGPVFVMSEALDDVMREFEGISDLVPIQPPPGTDPMELILLLARADALVAANSSFSWWGGFLGERPGRPVVAPRPWFTLKRIDSDDLLMPDWITLDREDHPDPAGAVSVPAQARSSRPLDSEEHIRV
ncbi:MAG: alpha-1,2-fucosyltransferase [Pseudonocardia sp.]|uniref:alpha-1,2-fucosyltransferase n=1 Tax=Pseudonocardia sp. TaxID=60912 RepID=UPI001AC073F1|nr:alpha-1,2-fucosyltransferase [Pseudonocardia sp.]MBN9099999.1 alpha-1,2-fucosyltransferase [Pseudonocardia sp.]